MIHDQWGIGRVMPFDILAFIQSVIYKKPFKKLRSDFTKEQFLQSRYDVSDEITMLPDRKTFYMFDIDNVKNIFSHEDNNNGGAVIEVLIRDEFDYDITIGFMEGYEESNKPFTKYVEPCKWIVKTYGYNKECYDRCMDFFNGYKNICKSFGVEHVIGTASNFVKTTNLKPYYKSFKKELDK